MALLHASLVALVVFGVLVVESLAVQKGIQRGGQLRLLRQDQLTRTDLRERSQRSQVSRTLKKDNSSSSKKAGKSDSVDEEICQDDEAIFRTCASRKGGKKGRYRGRSLSDSSKAKRYRDFMPMAQRKGNRDGVRRQLKSSKKMKEEEGRFPPKIGGNSNLEIGDLALTFVNADFTAAIEDCDCRLDIEEALIKYLSSNFDTDDQEFLCLAVADTTSSVGSNGTSVTTLFTTVTFSLDNMFEMNVETDSSCSAESLVLCCVQEAINGQVNDFCVSNGCDLSLCSTDRRRKLEEEDSAVLLRKDKDKESDDDDDDCDVESDLTTYLSCAVEECVNLNFDQVLNTFVFFGVMPDELGLFTQCVADAEDSACSEFDADGCEVFTDIDCIVEETLAPTMAPTTMPSTNDPSATLTALPSATPTVPPTPEPLMTDAPTTLPTFSPTLAPVAGATNVPTMAPVGQTGVPTMAPVGQTGVPTLAPAAPLIDMTDAPVAVVAPTFAPSFSQSDTPTESPSASLQDTEAPTMDLTISPSPVIEEESLSLSMSLSMSMSMSLSMVVPPLVTDAPTLAPVAPTDIATVPPTTAATFVPSMPPTLSPTMDLTFSPTLPEDSMSFLPGVSFSLPLSFPLLFPLSFVPSSAPAGAPETFGPTGLTTSPTSTETGAPTAQ